MRQIAREEKFESDAPTVEAVLEWDEKYSQMIFDNLNEGSREFCQSAEEIWPSRTAIVKWTDGSLGAVMFWGDCVYVSAIFFEGVWKGEYIFDLDAECVHGFMTRSGAASALVLAPSQEKEALSYISRKPRWVDDPERGLIAQ